MILLKVSISVKKIGKKKIEVVSNLILKVSSMFICKNDKDQPEHSRSYQKDDDGLNDDLGIAL